ncbi:MAG: hypothetical protein ACKO6N_10710 [Myxococcota bacterium]
MQSSALTSWGLPSWSLLVLAVLMVLLSLAVWGGHALRRAQLRHRLQRRATRGREGEQEAERLLKRQGYRVLDRQVTQESGLWVDETYHAVKLRADFLVEKGDETFVVEVKTGEVAPDPTSAATRRQLLEYAHAYPVDGLLLADMHEGRLHRIVFESPEEASEGETTETGGRSAFWPGVLLGMGMGLGLAWGLLRL